MYLRIAQDQHKYDGIETRPGIINGIKKVDAKWSLYVKYILSVKV